MDYGSIRLESCPISDSALGRPLSACCFCVPLSPAGLMNQPKAFVTSGYPYQYVCVCVCVCVDRMTDRFSEVLKREVLIA